MRQEREFLSWHLTWCQEICLQLLKVTRSAWHLCLPGCLLLTHKVFCDRGKGGKHWAIDYTNSLCLLTWDQWDLNWNVCLNGFLKRSAPLSLQNLRLPLEKEKEVLMWFFICLCAFFLERMRKRMESCCWQDGHEIWGSSVLQRRVYKAKAQQMHLYIHPNNPWQAEGIVSRKCTE